MIDDVVATPKLKKLCSHIIDFPKQESSYVTVSTMVAHFPELQPEYLMAKNVQKKLVTNNLNVYSGK